MPVIYKVYAFILYIVAFILGATALYLTVYKGHPVVLTLLWVFTVLLIIAASFLSFTAGDSEG